MDLAHSCAMDIRFAADGKWLTPCSKAMSSQPGLSGLPGCLLSDVPPGNVPPSVGLLPEEV